MYQIFASGRRMGARPKAVSHLRCIGVAKRLSHDLPSVTQALPWSRGRHAPSDLLSQLDWKGIIQAWRPDLSRALLTLEGRLLATDRQILAHLSGRSRLIPRNWLVARDRLSPRPLRLTIAPRQSLKEVAPEPP